MPAASPQPTETISGRIVYTEPRADRYTRWVLLSVERGFVNIMAASKVAQPYSLFDRVELIASSRGKNFFLKEAHLIERPTHLASRWHALQEASALARLLQTAFAEMPDYRPVAEIFERALELYASATAPQIITLKAVYKILQAEGFPVAQDWLEHLPEAQQATARALLYESADLPAEATYRSLIKWMGQELGMRV
jgi:hypothetical protein